jgi:hypothetical protein
MASLLQSFDLDPGPRRGFFRKRRRAERSSRDDFSIRVNLPMDRGRGIGSVAVASKPTKEDIETYELNPMTTRPSMP